MEETKKTGGVDVTLVSNDHCALVIELPREFVNVDNMKKLLEQKGALIRKSLGVSTTNFAWNENLVMFPWWDKMPSPEEAQAYVKFLAALCKLTVNAKRINDTGSKEIENEKYAFRCFLLRLGFVGPECKEDRKILLRNFSGNSAFKKKGDR